MVKFFIKVVKDWYGPMQWNKERDVSVPSSTSESESDEESEEDVGATWEEELFGEEDVSFSLDSRVEGWYGAARTDSTFVC